MRTVSFRRNLAVAARSGDGPFTIRFADLHDRAMQTSGLLSWRSTPRLAALSASRMEARAAKAPGVRTSCSYVPERMHSFWNVNTRRFTRLSASPTVL